MLWLAWIMPKSSISTCFFTLWPDPSISKEWEDESSSLIYCSTMTLGDAAIFSDSFNFSLVIYSWTGQYSFSPIILWLFSISPKSSISACFFTLWPASLCSKEWEEESSSLMYCSTITLGYDPLFFILINAE